MTKTLTTLTTPTAPPAAQQRVEQTLDRIEQLTELLAADDDYVAPPLEFELPPGFKLSVVIPVYNEEGTIRQILSRVLAQPVPLEVVVVDDKSVDMTRDVLAQLEGLPQLKIVYKPKNEGKGAALRTGFEHATGDIVVIQDADLEYDPRDIPPLLAPILQGEADVVYGSRYLANGAKNSSFVHRLGNGLLTLASNRLTGLRLTDMETCYKVFRRDVVRDFDITQDRFGFEPEVTAKLARAGYRLRELPVSYDARDFDEGKKIGLRDAFNALWCILRYGWSD
ncbi:MAG: glycosyltransferase family 2 protein [Planctomycetales bacterium]|nr:glycosyltransferase family 2 protein [Planctomycetales bacterium]